MHGQGGQAQSAPPSSRIHDPLDDSLVVEGVDENTDNVPLAVVNRHGAAVARARLPGRRPLTHRHGRRCLGVPAATVDGLREPPVVADHLVSP
jgi:hypothetical protein